MVAPMTNTTRWRVVVEHINGVDGFPLDRVVHKSSAYDLADATREAAEKLLAIVNLFDGDSIKVTSAEDLTK
jgi:hypothetical protein